ncbi:MAG TPA: hypothetical protein VH702_03865 [Vicinamibacterales bacterium]|jgi:hypothetical protein
MLKTSFATCQHDGVDSTHDPTVLCNFVQERHDDLLAGVRDVETGETVSLGLGQQVGQAATGKMTWLEAYDAGNGPMWILMMRGPGSARG